MSDPRIFTDEELTAYLDGESQHAPISQVEEALASDPTLRARLEQLSIDKDAISSSFASLLATAPTSQLLDKVSPEENAGGSTWQWRQIAAACILALMVGFGSATLFNNNSKSDWMAYVAAYQALYSNSTLAHIEQSEGSAVSELARVSAALGKDIPFEVVSKVGQLDYKRAQILTYRGKPLIQLAYLSKVGTPVALCIIKSDTKASNAIKLAVQEEMQAAYWSKDGYDYLLIGGKDESLIANAAEFYSERI